MLPQSDNATLQVVNLSQTCVCVEILYIACDFQLKNNRCSHSICHVFQTLNASSHQHHHAPKLFVLSLSWKHSTFAIIYITSCSFFPSFSDILNLSRRYWCQWYLCEMAKVTWRLHELFPCKLRKRNYLIEVGKNDSRSLAVTEELSLWILRQNNFEALFSLLLRVVLGEWIRFWTIYYYYRGPAKAGTTGYP